MFLIAATLDGWNINLTGQLANSPDMNINNLSFFRALQSGQWDSVEDANHNVDGLVEAETAASITTSLPLIFLSPLRRTFITPSQ